MLTYCQLNFFYTDILTRIVLFLNLAYFSIKVEQINFKNKILCSVEENLDLVTLIVFLMI